VDHPVATPPRAYTALVGACLVCIAALVVAAGHGLLFWSGDLPTMAGIPLSIIGVVVIVFAVGAAWRRGQPLWLRLAPLLFCAVTLLILIYVPFSRIGIDWDFAAHKTEREALAQHIIAHWHGEEADTVPLRLGAPVYPRDAGAAEVASCGQATCVLFLTWPRTEFQAAEGYLYVPVGGDPALFHWDGHLDATPLGGRWWYVREVR
jgi:uncharacterized protein (DUF983 family)